MSNPFFTIDQFTAARVERTWVLVAEASSLKWPPGGKVPDLIRVRGHRVTVHFKLEHTERDGSGEDVLGWRYRATGGVMIPTFIVIHND